MESLDGHKRSAEEAGLALALVPVLKAPKLDPPPFRVEDILDSFDPSVRIKLRSMFDDGLVKEGELDQGVLEDLKQFDASIALEILDKFTTTDLSTVHRKSAFLAGIISRNRKHAKPKLDSGVTRRLDDLYSQGHVRPGDLDARCMDALSSMNPSLAMAVIDKFAAKDFSDVRNMSALFMSTIKQTEGDFRARGRDSSGAHHSHRPPHRHHSPPSHYAHYADRHGPPPGGARGSRDYMRDPPSRGGPTRAPPPPLPHAAPPPVLYAPPVDPYAGRGLYAPVAMPNGRTAYGPPAIYGPPPPAAPPMLRADAKRNYGPEQAAMGVRVNEFHALSPFAPFVHSAPALKLQNLWDAGNELVSLLDDKAWEVLSELAAPEGLAVVEDAAQKLDSKQIRNINAYFMSVARKYVAPKRGDYDDRGHHHDRDRDRGGGGALGPPSSSSRSFSRQPAMHMLPARLRDKAQDLCERHRPMLRAEHFDEGVIETLAKLSDVDAMQVLVELDENQLVGVRNVPAYIMGICKRYQRRR